jgi:hypothetical protein
MLAIGKGIAGLIRLLFGKGTNAIPIRIFRWLILLLKNILQGIGHGR